MSNGRLFYRNTFFFTWNCAIFMIFFCFLMILVFGATVHFLLNSTRLFHLTLDIFICSFIIWSLFIVILSSFSRFQHWLMSCFLHVSLRFFIVSIHVLFCIAWNYCQNWIQHKSNQLTSSAWSEHVVLISTLEHRIPCQISFYCFGLCCLKRFYKWWEPLCIHFLFFFSFLCIFRFFFCVSISTSVSRRLLAFSALVVWRKIRICIRWIWIREEWKIYKSSHINFMLLL